MFDVPTKNIRVGPNDLDAHVAWIPTVRAKLNPGSDWWIEVGHNGNGNIEVCLMNQNLFHSGLIQFAIRLLTRQTGQPNFVHQDQVRIPQLSSSCGLDTTSQS
jgi:hypothetical protein